MDELSTELSMMGKLMDATALRTRVIAHNLANVNTPGFTRSKVVFEETLGEALHRGDWDEAKEVKPEVAEDPGDEAKEVKPEVAEDPGGEVKGDGNNVHMETEMADLVKNTILYNIVNRILTGKIKGLELAIRGR
jgi:flagellar basal-body rod protein FlgB